MSNNRLQQYHVLVQQMLDQYRIVEQNVNRVSSELETTSATDALEPIKQLLDQVKQTESELKPIRDSLQADGATVPPETKALVDDTVKIVTTLIPRIGAMEQKAVESRERLAPVIREGVRAVKMKSAYAKQQT